VMRRACLARGSHVVMKTPVRRRRAGVVVPFVVGLSPVVAAAAPPVFSVPAAAVVASTLGVDAFDLGSFVLRLTRQAIPAGTLTIYFRNRDVSDHNLWIEGPGVDAPLQVSGDVGENGTATTKLAVGAGSWRLFCALPGHEAMSATLAVG